MDATLFQRATANRFYWQTRYARLPDGSITAIYRDGSGGQRPVKDDIVALLNQQAYLIEQLREVEGDEHSWRGIGAAIVQAVNLHRTAPDATVAGADPLDYAVSLIHAHYKRMADRLAARRAS